MNKTDFLWCLARCTSPPRFDLRADGDGWMGAFRLTVVCYAENAPRRLPSGKAIGDLSGEGFLVASFLGGDLIESDKNIKTSRRAEAALAKYKRWAAVRAMEAKP